MDTNKTYKELKEKAKMQGIKGYSTMNKGDFMLALHGVRVPKKLRKNQVSVGTQTNFLICNECGLKDLVTKLYANQRKIAHIDDMEIDVETGEVLGYEVDYSRY